MNYVQKASILTKNILIKSPGKCKKVDVHSVKVRTLYIKTSLLKKVLLTIDLVSSVHGKCSLRFIWAEGVLMRINNLKTVMEPPSSEIPKTLPKLNSQPQRTSSFEAKMKKLINWVPEWPPWCYYSRAFVDSARG